MKAKKWSILLIVMLILTLVVFAVLMFIMDPLLQYRKESNLLTYYEYSEMYSNPGIAQQYEYDAVMVGTSMIQNTNVDECDELFGCNMVRLPYSGGTTYNMKTILDICFQSENNIKTVYWELDEFQLLGSSTEPRYPLPEYLYRNDYKEDLSYLLNLDVFYHYGLNSVLGTLKGQTQQAERRYDTLYGEFGKESVLSGYQRPEITTTVRSFGDIKQRVDANLERNIIPVIENNKNTEFVFFMVPFSILYWDMEVRNGSFDSTMDAVEYTMKKLLAYENVKIYFYHDEWDVATNLDNYKDYSHYGSWINSYMIQKMANNEKLVTQDNYTQYVEEMRKYIYNYEFDEIFE